LKGSLQHYRAALKIDPDFVTSQVGLGDTYALMGNQEQARIEYDKAIRYAHNEADRLAYSMQKAMTFVRDGKFADADKLFQEIAETAHAKEQDLQEAQAYRHLAEYQTDDNAALKYLQSAEESWDIAARFPSPTRMRNCRAFCATVPCAPRMPGIRHWPTNL
jgi:tetratricopeptide (TPR) repeat protein